MLFAEGFTFRNFLVDVFAVFIFVVWFWLLISVYMDLFRRHDVSGWAKAIWVIAILIFPYLGVFAYLITQSQEWLSEPTSKLRRRATTCDTLLDLALPMRLRNSTALKRLERLRISSSRGCAPS